MAFSEVDLKRSEQTVGVVCGKRSPRHLKEKLRLMYAVKGHEVVIVERRPRWDNQTEWTETPVGEASSSSGRQENGDCIGRGLI